MQQVEAGRRRYRNPPIEEALCEFQFVPGPEWDLTMPGLIWERLKAEYPAKPRSQAVSTVQVGQQAGGPSIELQQAPPRIQFRSADLRHLVAVGPGVLSVHMLRPYTGWEHLEARVASALLSYCSVAEPVGISRIGVRYINRIVVMAATVDLSDYFTSPPDPPSALPQQLASFIMRWESSFDDIDGRLVTTFASVPEDGEQCAFILDIDVIREWADPMPIQDAMVALNDLRARESVVFEALIQDKAREVFDDE